MLEEASLDPILNEHDVAYTSVILLFRILEKKDVHSTISSCISNDIISNRRKNSEKKLVLKISFSYKVPLGEFKSASLELLNETGHPRKVALLI